VLNEVQGVYSPDGSSDELFYLTSASQAPWLDQARQYPVQMMALIHE
jgi:hypothetical protein